MKIGIDIDGCLNNFHAAMSSIIKRDYGIETPEEIYYMVEELNLDKDEWEAFWEKYNPELLDMMDVTPGAIEVLTKLRRIGCHLTIITARDYRVAELTIEWLKKHNVPYDEIYFTAEHKHEVCKWKRIKYMIEDNPAYAIKLAEAGIEVALYSRSYNKELKHDNINAVESWDDIYHRVFDEVIGKF